MALVCREVNDCACAVLSFPLVAMCFDLAPRHDGDVRVAVHVGVHRQHVPRLFKGVNSAGEFSSIKGCVKQ